MKRSELKSLLNPFCKPFVLSFVIHLVVSVIISRNIKLLFNIQKLKVFLKSGFYLGI